MMNRTAGTSNSIHESMVLSLYYNPLPVSNPTAQVHYLMLTEVLRRLDASSPSLMKSE